MRSIKAYIHSIVIFLTNYFIRLPVAILMLSKMRVRCRNSRIVHSTSVLSSDTGMGDFGGEHL